MSLKFGDTITVVGGETANKEISAFLIDDQRRLVTAPVSVEEPWSRRELMGSVDLSMVAEKWEVLISSNKMFNLVSFSLLFETDEIKKVDFYLHTPLKDFSKKEVWFDLGETTTEKNFDISGHVLRFAKNTGLKFTVSKTINPCIATYYAVIDEKAF